ncbi:LysM peptidoglycan-binding domain-containing protein [Petralouisia muris]|uniref:LysM peptidoglycan-binding domain-containing protein n=1 Tax=Petralouisia muris TaxID=3032872 RepID=UPI0014427DD1|nr:LysM peptidoglycan-binding domain-containing protein [Petralouisia muris]
MNKGNGGSRPELAVNWKTIRICLFLFILSAGFILAWRYAVYVRNTAAEEGNCKSYTSIEIRPGDSLWSIAAEYMTEDYDSVQDYVQEIKIWNGLETDEIHAGRFLIVPYHFSQ